MEEKTERLVAKHLLEIGAVFLRPEQPFTWASGIQSPIYCDNRLTLTAPKARDDIEAALAELIISSFPDCQKIMGTATAGIAHAAIAAHILKMPMGYVRSNAKDHGRGKQVEGRLEKGDKVVVVEDLISTAKSSVETAEILRAEGAEVLGIVSIFSYGMVSGRERLGKEKLQSVSLCKVETLLDVAVEGGYIKQDDKVRVLAFCKNPDDESWRTAK